MLLKTSESTESTIQPGESRVKVGYNNRAKRDSKYEPGSEIDDSEVDDNEIGDNEIRKKDEKIFKSQNLTKFKNLTKSKKLSRTKKTIKSSNFFTAKAKLAFTKLKHGFIKASILPQFDLEHYISVETNISSYAIGGVLG